MALVTGTQFGHIVIGTSATSLTGMGVFAGSTLTTDAAHTVGVDSLGRYYKQDSSAVSGNNVGWSAPNQHTRMDCPSSTSFVMEWPTLTSIRIFVGLIASSSIGVGCDADTLGAIGFGFQFSTDRGDTTFQVVSYNGTTQSAPASVGFTVATNTTYRFCLNVTSSTSVSWSVHSAAGSLLGSGTLTTNLPASTTTLYALTCLEPRSASARSLVTRHVAAFNYGYTA